MGTLTAGLPRLEEHCPHKLPSSCRLTATPRCCACDDRRPHAGSYRIYVDGVGFVYRGTRWQNYCWFCKVFWENRVAAAHPRVTPSLSRIPEYPDQSEFLTAWFEFHQGYSVRTGPNGDQTRHPILGESLEDVSPGLLPRTLAEIHTARHNVNMDAPRPDLHQDQIINAAEEPSVSIEDTLDQLMLEADGESHPQTSGTNTSTSSGQPSSHNSSSAAQHSMNPNTTTNDGVNHPSRREDRHLRQLRQRLTSLLSRSQSLRHSISITAAFPDIEQVIEQLNPSEMDSDQLNEAMNRLEIATVQPDRNQQQMARVFGTREDVQSDTYVSPITDMFSRAYARYQDAEAQRQDGEPSTSPTNTQAATPPSTSAVTNASNTGNGAATTHGPNPFDPRVGYDEIARMIERLDARAENFLGSSTVTPSRAADIPAMPALDHRPLFASMRRARIAASGSTSSVISNAASSATPNVTSDPTSATPSSVTSTTTTILNREGVEAFATLDARRRELQNRLSERTAGSAELTRQSELLRQYGDGLNGISDQWMQQYLEIYRQQRDLNRRHDTTSSAPVLGLDDDKARPPPKSDEQMTVTLCCRVCLTQMADIVLLPCGHLVLCQWCAKLMYKTRDTDRTMLLGKNQCPVCRRSIKRRVRVFTSGFDTDASAEGDRDGTEAFSAQDGKVRASSEEATAAAAPNEGLNSVD